MSIKHKGDELISPNQHINVYLDYYLGLENSPQFAVMINAPWGTGKTFFIQKYLEQWQSQNKDKKIIFISLYGLSNVVEIDDAIFQQMHPILGSPHMKLAARIGKGFLKGALKIDLDINDDGQKESLTINSQLPDFNKDDLPDWLKNSDKNILVFDDLERSNFEISSLLGYINQFNEHQNHKIILIANEEQITKKDTSYQQIKEKLIGKTFLLMGDHESAISTFINQTTCTQTQKILSTQKALISKFIQRYKNHNLRIIQQIFYDFERLIQAIDNKFLNNQKFIAQLLESFLIICYEHKKGELETKQLSREYMVDYYKIYNDPENFPKDFKKYPLLKYDDIENNHNDCYSICTNLLNESIWKEILDQSVFSAEAINNDIKNTSFFTSEPLWWKLTTYTKLEDSDLLSTLDQVKKRIQDNKIANIYETLYFWGTFLEFNEELKIISNTELADLRLQLLDNIDRLIELDPHVQTIINEIDNITILDSRVNGLPYRSENYPEFKKFVDDLSKKFDSYIKSNRINRVQDILKLIKNDINLFTTNLSQNENNLEFIKSDILNMINTADFLKIYQQLTSNQQKRINQNLCSRYKRNPNLLKAEKNWLVQLINEFNKYISTLNPEQLMEALSIHRCKTITSEIKIIIS